jgi:hypothetical protein
MPPRYAYWTIIVDDQPTAFRSGSQEDLMPTFKRLQQRNASAKMMWWQNGKLWDSRIDAQEAMRARGEMGRRGDERQAGGYRDRERAPRSTERPPSARDQRSPSGKLAWKPKGEGEERPRRPEWSPKSPASGSKPQGRPEWKPKSFGARPKADWKPRGSGSGAAKRAWTPKSQAPAARIHGKLEWQPKGQDSGSRSYPKSQDPGPRSPEKRKWVPKEEYKKSQGIEAKRDKNWRPGGAHKDPRQKYKDAKKAKWGRFKQTIRKRWESKTGKKNEK